MFIFENTRNCHFIWIFYLIHLLLLNCIQNYILPNFVQTESLKITHNDTVLLCSWKTDIDSSHITDKTDCSLFIFHHLLSIKSWTNCAQNYHCFFSSLKWIDCSNLKVFCIDDSLNASNLLTVRWYNTDVFAVFFNVLCKFVDKFRFLNIDIRAVFTFLITSFNMKH